MIFSIVLEVFHGYDDECLLQLLVDDIDSSVLDVDYDDEDMLWWICPPQNCS